jgi:hypothetical protein
MKFNIAAFVLFVAPNGVSSSREIHAAIVPRPVRVRSTAQLSASLPGWNALSSKSKERKIARKPFVNPL